MFEWLASFSAHHFRRQGGVLIPPVGLPEESVIDAVVVQSLRKRQQASLISNAADNHIGVRLWWNQP